MAYRIVYCQGSFALAASCESREQALSRARSLVAKAGVWHVQVEDSDGRPVVRSFELQAAPRLPAMPVGAAHLSHARPALRQLGGLSEER
jgi:hypothetical protein